MKVTQIRVSELKRGEGNVRERYSKEGLAELRASIFQHGVLVPVHVVGEPGSYEVLDGGRRLHCAAELGMEKVPALVLDEREDPVSAAAWVCNFERESVPFMEEARWMGRMVQKTDGGVEGLSILLGRSPGYVRSRLAVLDWPVALLTYCDAGSISYSVAREYARLGESVELERAIEWDGINQPSYRQGVAYVDEILRARELLVPSEPVSEPAAASVPVCEACGGERDPKTSRTLIVCAGCLRELGV